MTGDSAPISRRGIEATKQAADSLAWRKTMKDLYHPSTNPSGFINIGIAENSLLHEELADYHQKNFKLDPMDFTYGDSLSGSYRLFAALSKFFNNYFKSLHPVTPEQMVAGCGLTSVINQLCSAIAEPGDGILIAAPYYQGFDRDLLIFADVIPIPVLIPNDHMLTLKEVDQLENALIKYQAASQPIKAILLCNPHNPLGQCYSPEVILAYAQLCEKYNLHLISDEIYALAVFPTKHQPDPEPFVSALTFDFAAHDVDPSRVHVLYGMSKDFNANGFRVGILVSQNNPTLLDVLSVFSVFMRVASPSSALWSAMLNDDEYLQAFISKNRLKLRGAYEYLTSWLDFHGIPYSPSNAGQFLMVDFRTLLADVEKYGKIIPITGEMDMQARERALGSYFKSHKVLVNAGRRCHYPEAGWFRFTFAVRRDFMQVALKRMENAMHWEQWSELPV